MLNFKNRLFKCAIAAKQWNSYLHWQISNGIEIPETKPQRFIEQYLHWIKIRTMYCKGKSCTSSDSENACMIYDVTKSMQRIPHTDRKQFQQITDLTWNICMSSGLYIVEEWRRNCLFKKGFSYLNKDTDWEDLGWGLINQISCPHFF
jgi:hypothetical protein